MKKELSTKMSPSRTLIQGATILSMDETVGDLPAGDILLSDGKIEAVGTGLSAPDAELVDARGMIAFPGFVDAHRHTWQTQLHGARTDWNHLDYLTYVRGLWSNCFDPADAWLGNHVGALEALDSGITTLVDHSHLQISEEHSDALVEGLKASQIRGIFCYGTYRNPSMEGLDSEEIATLVEEMAGPLSDWHRANAERVRSLHFPEGEDSRLLFGVATSEFSKFHSPDPLKYEMEWARSLRPQVITTHIATTANEPLRAVEVMKELDLLDRDILLVHGNHLKESELRTAAEAGVSIVSAVEPEMTYGAWPVVRRFSAIGGTPALGIDVMIDFSSDMFGQMRTLLNIWRLEEALTDPGRMTRKIHQRRVLEVATILGARAIGMEHLVGSISPGKRADIALMRTDGLGMAPMINPYAAVVAYGHPSVVDTVFVDGTAVKRKGVLLGVDWDDLRDRLFVSQRSIASRAENLPEQAVRHAWASRFKVRIDEEAGPRAKLSSSFNPWN